LPAVASARRRLVLSVDINGPSYRLKNRLTMIGGDGTTMAWSPRPTWAPRPNAPGHIRSYADMTCCFGLVVSCCVPTRLDV
jgi:hypothetical protein